MANRDATGGNAFSGRLPAPLTLACVLLCVAALFGGGGSPAVIAESIVVFAALMILALMLAARIPVIPAVNTSVIVIGCALPLLALLQLVPLPYQIWRHLPARDALAAGLAAAGTPHAAWPLSISPASTLAAALSFIPPLAAFVLTSLLGERDRRRMLIAMVVVGACSACLGLVQAIGGEAYYIYDRSIRGFPSGLFANHNAQGDCLLIALCAAAGLLPSTRDRTARLVLAGVVALLGLGLLLSGSRTSLLLAAIPMALGARYLAARFRGATGRRTILAAVAGAVIAGGFVIALLVRNPLVEHVMGRFQAEADPRFTRLWPDSWYAAKLLFPFGSGLGTFTPAFEQVERLEIVAPGAANRAHMDYIELLIETGAAGIVVLVATLAILARRAFSRSSLKYYHDVPASVGWAIIVIIAAHSFVDYPLRAMLLSMLFAMGCAFLFARPGGEV